MLSIKVEATLTPLVIRYRIVFKYIERVCVCVCAQHPTTTLHHPIMTDQLFRHEIEKLRLIHFFSFHFISLDSVSSLANNLIYYIFGVIYVFWDYTHRAVLFE